MNSDKSWQDNSPRTSDTNYPYIDENNKQVARENKEHKNMHDPRQTSNRMHMGKNDQQKRHEDNEHKRMNNVTGTKDHKYSYVDENNQDR